MFVNDEYFEACVELYFLIIIVEFTPFFIASLIKMKTVVNNLEVKYINDTFIEEMLYKFFFYLMPRCQGMWYSESSLSGTLRS